MSGRPPAPPPDLPGFQYVGLLGSGGFSDVYQYTQLGLDRLVAVKVLLEGVGEADQQSFQAEANVMAKLSNHPSIVSIYQAGVTTDGRPFLVMEFCPPPHLGLQLRARPLSPAKALEVTIQLAGAVATAHKLGILHRDIKPANILFTEFGRPALTDFGISVATQAAESGGGVGMSVPWAPPEQLRAGAPMGVTGDVYALGATLWTALAGRSPFHVPGGANDPLAMSQRVRGNPVPRVGRAGVPESLERVLATAMAKAPEERFPSAVDLARALQGVQAELHQSVTPFDVRDDARGLGVLEEEGQGGTRVSGFVSVDPESPARTADPVASTVDRDDTVLGAATGPRTEPGAVVPVVASVSTEDTVGPASAPGPVAPPAAGTEQSGQPGQPEQSEQSGAARRALAGIAAAVVVGVLAVVVVTQALGNGEDGTTSEREDPADEAPADPLGSTARVPTPTDPLVSRIGGGRVRATWTNPAPEPGDRFAYRLLDPDAPGWEWTSDSEAVLETRPGRQCVLVRLVRADGSPSDTIETCPEDER